MQYETCLKVIIKNNNFVKSLSLGFSLLSVFERLTNITKLLN